MSRETFNSEEYTSEHQRRIKQLKDTAQHYETSLEEEARIIIEKGINPNPDDVTRVIPGEPYVILGHDGRLLEWFTMGSFPNLQDAVTIRNGLRKQEADISDGDSSSSTFHVFSSEGSYLDPMIDAE